MSIGVHFDDDEGRDDDRPIGGLHDDDDYSRKEDDTCSSTPTPENSKD